MNYKSRTNDGPMTEMEGEAPIGTPFSLSSIKDLIFGESRSSGASSKTTKTTKVCTSGFPDRKTRRKQARKSRRLRSTSSSPAVGLFGKTSTAAPSGGGTARTISVMTTTSGKGSNKADKSSKAPSSSDHRHPKQGDGREGTKALPITYAKLCMDQHKNSVFECARRMHQEYGNSLNMVTCFDVSFRIYRVARQYELHNAAKERSKQSTMTEKTSQTTIKAPTGEATVTSPGVVLSAAGIEHVRENLFQVSGLISQNFAAQGLRVDMTTTLDMSFKILEVLREYEFHGHTTRNVSNSALMLSPGMGVSIPNLQLYIESIKRVADDYFRKKTPDGVTCDRTFCVECSIKIHWDVVKYGLPHAPLLVGLRA